MRYNITHNDAITSEMSPPSQSGVTDFSSGVGQFSCGNLSAISFQGQQPWTFEIWVYLDALLDQMNLISREGEFVWGTRGAQVYAARANQVLPLVSDPLLEERTWYHLALAFDGYTMYLYLNGLQVKTVGLDDNGTSHQGKPMMIGGGFYGQIDSVRFWNSFVPGGQIYTNQWNDFAAGTAGLVAQLDFSQQPPVDTSGNNVTITPSASGTGFRLFTPVVELSNNGFCDNYEDGSINPGGQAQDFSTIAWICPTHVGTPMAIFTNGPSDGTAGTFLTVAPGGQMSFQVGNSAPLPAKTILRRNTWYNIACTWQAATQTGTIYVNGTLDASQSGMSLTGTLTSGAPLIGAVAMPPENLPVNGFEGYIQSVSVWNVALQQSQIQQYMTADPTSADNCIANYQFAVAPAQNYMTLKPVGLAGGAQLTVLNSLTTSSFQPVGQRPLNQEAADEQSSPLVNIDEAYLSDEAHEAMAAEFRQFMQQIGVPDERLGEFEQRLLENLRRARNDIRAGTYRTPFPTVRSEESTDLDACTSWSIEFIISIVGAAFTAFGLVWNFKSVAPGVTKFLGTRITDVGLTPQLRAVFSRGVSTPAIWKALKLLYEFGLLTPIMRLFWQALKKSVTIWTIISVGGRLILLLGPSAPLEVALFITELGYSLYSVVSVWQKPENCWKSTGEQASTDAGAFRS